MNPPPLMKLVEIIPGLPTSDATFQTTRALAERLGKETVSSRDIPGFIVNRILMPMLNEACFALYEGIASVDDIDSAINLGLKQLVKQRTGGERGFCVIPFVDDSISLRCRQHWNVRNPLSGVFDNRL